ncbi:MAG TPA: hypothetical protein VFB22_01835 [Candidatus Baltobacteraceae bacterium]|nr:hypothetical protein [Candidatus Baltobacteraceae bacterium]
MAAAAQLADSIAGVVAGSCTFAVRGLAGAVARDSLVPGILIPPGAVRTLIYRVCEPDIASPSKARGLAPAMRNSTMRALIGYDVLADVHAIRVPITFIRESLTRLADDFDQVALGDIAADVAFRPRVVHFCPGRRVHRKMYGC